MALTEKDKTFIRNMVADAITLAEDHTDERAAATHKTIGELLELIRMVSDHTNQTETQIRSVAQQTNTSLSVLSDHTNQALGELWNRPQYKIIADEVNYTPRRLGQRVHTDEIGRITATEDVYAGDDNTEIHQLTRGTE